MEHFSVKFEPDGKLVSIHRGATLLEAAGQAGIILDTVCGGKGTCRKCLVKLEPDGREVLACQYRVENDLVVVVPAGSRFFEQKILEHGIDRDIRICPCVCKRYLKIAGADVSGFESALKDSLGNDSFKISANAAEQFKQLAADGADSGLTVVLRGQVPCGLTDSGTVEYTAQSLEQGDTTASIFGVAVDIGTTTVVARLVDLTSGKCLATAAVTNPQTIYGDDVISRIAYGQTQKKLVEMQKIIIGCINELVSRLCKQADIEATSIYEITAAGNTTMNHIFLALPIKQLGQAPYAAYSLDACDRPAEQMGLNINPEGNVHTIENIAGFVGSDTTAVAVAVGIDMAEEMTLIVDIGTNGEIVLGTKQRLLAASCAAGPALEGARISCGSRAIDGAIERVVVNEDIDVDVIAGGEARSICGSGLIDAVAVLLDLGIIDPTGRFVEPEKLAQKLPKAILSRIVERNGRYAFVLAGNSRRNEAVILTQKDIREMQLAKAALRAGVRILQDKMHTRDDDIRHILLAGAFGNYIRRKSAMRIGLLPQVPIERIHFVGNAAGSGAQMVLSSAECRALAGHLAQKIEYVEIAHSPEFQMVFAESLLF